MTKLGCRPEGARLGALLLVVSASHDGEPQQVHMLTVERRFIKLRAAEFNLHPAEQGTAASRGHSVLQSPSSSHSSRTLVLSSTAANRVSAPLLVTANPNAEPSTGSIWNDRGSGSLQARTAVEVRN